MSKLSIDDKNKFAAAMAFLDVNAETLGERARQGYEHVTLLIKAFRMALSAPSDWMAVSHFTVTLMVGKRIGFGPGIVEPSAEKIAEHMQLLTTELGV